MTEKLLDYSKNILSMTGAVLVTASATLFLAFFGMDLLGFEGGPYAGILFFLILPGVFVVGLLLIPIGAWWTRRRAHKAHAGAPPFPVFDLNSPRVRKGALVFVGLTVINIAILGMAGYKGLEVMDSVKFCGAACHDVMEPEYTAYQRSAHSRVRCTECHIGSGANWFVKSKLSGSWQLISVTFGLYPTPIETPVRNLRPARDTCEACHWPEKFVGDKLKVNTHYTDDEETKAAKSVLLLHVGGQGQKRTAGIHWHVSPGVKIRYLSDPKRQTIRDVELKVPNGETRLYKLKDEPAAKPGEKPAGPDEWRNMDCVDCHNRPTHIYSTPEIEIDAALASGRLDTSLPFIRREGLKALKGDYHDEAQARAKVAEALTRFWAKDFAEKTQDKKAAVDGAVDVLTDIWKTHVFPKMKVGWGTYPSFLGHQETEGCFRCHDDNHVAGEKKISQKCGLCHNVLADSEENPEVLQQLDLK